MDYVKLGSTGLDVSPICLGCMTYGDPQRGSHAWSLPEDEARPFFQRAVEAGVNFFDTADIYSDGSSEEITGRALKDLIPREDLVLATKVYNPMRPGRPNGRGLSRKAVLTGIDASLTRLGMDHVDLYQIHRWDYGTPIEETMEALHDVVKSGKARYIGASSMYAWQFQKAQNIAIANGWTPFVTMQDHYNLLAREEEREMLPYCLDSGVGVIPWSPLARGKLTRAWDSETSRSETDEFGKTLYADTDREIVQSVLDVAQARGVAPASVALAWVLRHPAVSAPIVGASKPHHLDDAIAAVDLELTDDEVTMLEAAYTPRSNTGFQ